MIQNPRFDNQYPFDYHFLVPKLICTEVWPVRDLITQHAQIIFDVGASHGVWTKAWLDSFGPAVEQIHLFEPLPGNAAEIRDKVNSGFFEDCMPGVSGRLQLNEFGLGETDAMAVMHFDHPTSGLASLAQSACVLPDRVVQLDREIGVPVSTLDGYCREKRIEFVDLVKIDTEGYELNVLRGGQDLIDRKSIGVVLFEFGSHQRAQNHAFSDFFDFFVGRGYRLFQLGLGKQGWKRIEIGAYEDRFEDFSDTFMFGAYLPGFSETR